MMYFNILLLIWETFYFSMEAEGIYISCSVKQTLVVAQGSAATFQILSFSRYDYFHAYFVKEEPGVSRALAYITRRDSNDNLTFYIKDNDLVNRTQIAGRQHNKWQIGVTITISNISMSDNGQYGLCTVDRARLGCWILFVMQLNQEPTSAIDENKPVYIYAHPHASLVNATLMVWLVNGMYANETGHVIQFDGFIWIAHVQREMFGRNITYRAILDNGDVNDANLTLNVTYGPSQPLTLIPEKKQYYLASGDMMPDITCITDCNPSCSISWGKHSPGHTLSLGKLTVENTGDYTCTATRIGVDIVIKETINIYVAENTSFTTAIAVLASVQAVTTLAIGFYAFCLYIRHKGIWKFGNCLKCRPSLSSGVGGSKQTVERNEPSGNELQHYEVLDTDTR